MDKFILKSIEIKNFKGIENAKIDFQDEKTVLKAPNHSGKTSIRNAFEWCLCQNISDFLPKINNKEIYDLVTSVELILTINGTEYSLKRQSEGKYRISEETGRYEKTTNVSSYWIDNIEFSQTNYVKQLINLFRVDTVDLLPLLVIKDYFATGTTKFDWRERRKLLLKMGDAESCTKELVEQEQFANIKPYIDKKYATSDIKSSLEKERKAYKTRQEKNMILIEQKGLENAEIRKIDFEELQKELQNLEKEQKELRNKTLQELESESIKSISEQILKQTKELEKLRSEDAIALANKKKDLVDLYNQTKTIKLEIDKRLKDLELAKAQVEEIKKHKIDTICPTCKQQLPTEMQENAQKVIKTNLKNANNQVKSIENDIETLKSKYNTNKDKYNNGCIEVNEFEPNPVIAETEASIKGLKLALEQEKNLPTRVLLEDKEKNLAEQIRFVQVQLSKQDILKANQEMADKWKSENIVLADNILQIDRKLTALDKFTRMEIKLVSEKVNKLFPDSVTFALFKENYNGSIDYECTPLYNNVRYESLSTGEQLVTNMAIQETLQNYFNVNLPIFIDNFECLTIPFESERQLICLQVAETPNFNLTTIKETLNKGE